MRGLKNNAPIDYTLNNEFLRSSISLGIICPANYERVFFDFITQLNSQIQANYNTDYVITFPGFYEAFKTGVSIPAVNSCQWAEISWECPNAQLKKIKKGKGDRRAWMSGTIAVLLKPEAVIGPYENS